MDTAQGQVIDPAKLDLKSFDVWENMWKMGCTHWHIDFVEPYVCNIM